jgi:hypothetical protein
MLAFLARATSGVILSRRSRRVDAVPKAAGDAAKDGRRISNYADLVGAMQASVIDRDRSR